MVMDIATLAKELTDFLTPVIPFLIETTERIAAGEAIKRLSAAGWEQAKALWEKLKPRVEAKPNLQEALQDVAQDPKNEDAQVSLRYQFTKLLTQDPTLAAEIAKILQSQNPVQLGKYNLNIGTATDLAIGDNARLVKPTFSGNVEGSYIGVAGGDVKIATSQSSGIDIRTLFDSVLDRVRKRPADPHVDITEIIGYIDNIRNEVASGQKANLTKLGRWLKHLAEIAPDIHEPIIAILERPDIAEPVRLLAADVRKVN
ncbi:MULTISPECIES: hypothetical protein [unclassified Nostoc]|uniref:hypothetical protein n=1 Tax=unclassified Nostoc TaxID=2593658 RepID=UPI000CF30ABD|nr:hypothetical protein [Nostoc sp. 'Peltigera membranacea cyanobiont' N6]AVH63775.1 hypothetical protein NPM_2015 [Nostoc sp. 'Peltigera membranacea cyanobiont' N6]